MKKIRVLLVDDHKIFAEGIESMLSSHYSIKVTGKAVNCKDLFKILKNESIDVVILDAFMPEQNVIDILARINIKYPDTRVIVMSGNDEEILAKEVFQAGALGYLLKSADAAELYKAIHTVFNGEKYVCKLPNLSSNGHSVLNQYENHIIQFLSQGLSYKEVAEVLKMSIVEVELSTSGILNKLQLSNTIELAKFAIQNKMIEL